MATTAPGHTGSEGGEPELTTLTIGTRRSALALKQADLVVAALQHGHPKLQIKIHAMATAGDRDKTTPLPNLGKGLWTSELEALLVAGDVDLVVHSLKDVPTTLPAGCALGCVTEREDPRDVVVFRQRQDSTAAAAADKAQAQPAHRSLADLPAGAVIGTSSVRRAAQLRRRYPGLAFRDVRGNIDTRLKKLDAADGPFDALILAAAGLVRMGQEGRIAQRLDSGSAGILHAVGQGALGLEVRAGDARVLRLLRGIEHMPTMLACFAERSVMRALEGGCSVPIGVETAWEEAGQRRLTLRATVVSLDGKEAVDGEDTAEVATLDEAEAFGRAVAQSLAAKGAQRILDVINATRGVTEPAGGDGPPEAA